TECNEDKKAEVKAIRDDYKKEWEKLQKKWFTRSFKAHLQDMRELAPVIRQLVELVKQFMDAYLLAKKEKALVEDRKSTRLNSSPKRRSSDLNECNEDKKAEVKAIRDDYKKEWEKLQKKWFTRSFKAHLQDMRELAPVIRQLVELVKQFMDAYLLAKKEKALV